MRPDAGRTTRLRAVARLLALEVVLLAGVAAVWSGCTVTKSNYKVLSFFFDGVPDPTLPPGAVSRDVGGRPVFVVLHKPYAEENCDACHRSRYRPSRDDSRVCLECHEEVKTEHPRMHGPVVADACLWCHNPHESAHPALLRNHDRKVCGQCHTPALLSTRKVPAHADEARGCLECHSGHGGATSTMLKPGATAEQGPTGPTPGKD